MAIKTENILAHNSYSYISYLPLVQNDRGYMSQILAHNNRSYTSQILTHNRHGYMSYTLAHNNSCYISQILPNYPWLYEPNFSPSNQGYMSQSLAQISLIL